MTAATFLSTACVNSAKSVRITNSPGRMSGSMLRAPGRRLRSFGAPHGSNVDDVMVAGTESSKEKNTNDTIRDDIVLIYGSFDQSL